MRHSNLILIHIYDISYHSWLKIREHKTKQNLHDSGNDVTLAWPQMKYSETATLSSVSFKSWGTHKTQDHYHQVKYMGGIGDNEPCWPKLGSFVVHPVVVFAKRLSQKIQVLSAIIFQLFLSHLSTPTDLKIWKPVVDGWRCPPFQIFTSLSDLLVRSADLKCLKGGDWGDASGEWFLNFLKHSIVWKIALGRRVFQVF